MKKIIHNLIDLTLILIFSLSTSFLHGQSNQQKSIISDSSVEIQSTSLSVDITQNFCFSYGVTMTAIKPNSTNQQFYNSNDYHIQWFKNNELIQGANTYSISCVCDGVYSVNIFANASESTGKASVNAPICPENSGGLDKK